MPWAENNPQAMLMAAALNNRRHMMTLSLFADRPHGWQADMERTIKERSFDCYLKFHLKTLSIC
jgi:hypothetical protein